MEDEVDTSTSECVKHKNALESYTKELKSFALKKKKTETKSRLQELDKWLNDELPAELKERKHATLSDMTKVTEWKMLRGQWRPRNLQVFPLHHECTDKVI